MHYICRICRRRRPKFGACIACSSVSRPLATVGVADEDNHGRSDEPPPRIVYSDEVASDKNVRIKSGLLGVDRVLGGGFLPKTTTLIIGPQGIGKSTLLMQIAARSRHETLYDSGEEALEQVSARAKRLGLSPIPLLAETNVERIAEVISEDMALVIVDSLQMLVHPDSDRPPGSITQLRLSVQYLIEDARLSGYALVLTGHVNKKGDAAGPNTIAHLVDTVLTFTGNTKTPYRYLATPKNRGGATEVSATFKMTAKGLVGIKPPSVNKEKGKTS